MDSFSFLIFFLPIKFFSDLLSYQDTSAAMYQPMMGQRSQCHYPEWMDTENYALKYGLPTER